MVAFKADQLVHVLDLCLSELRCLGLVILDELAHSQIKQNVFRATRDTDTVNVT
jgi:hypothetical protein